MAANPVPKSTVVIGSGMGMGSGSGGGPSGVLVGAGVASPVGEISVGASVGVLVGVSVASGVAVSVGGSAVGVSTAGMTWAKANPGSRAMTNTSAMTDRSRSARSEVGRCKVDCGVIDLINVDLMARFLTYRLSRWRGKQDTLLALSATEMVRFVCLSPRRGRGERQTGILHFLPLARGVLPDYLP